MLSSSAGKVAPLPKLFVPPKSSKVDFSKTREYVAKTAPELLDLVDKGVLIAVPRRPDYVERRDDGYEEPLEVFVVGTSHVSKESARDVERAIRTLRPDNVVVEACRSRSALLYASDDPSSSPSTSQPSFLAGLSGKDLAKAFQQGGGVVILLRLLLAQLSKRAAARIKGVDITPGVDMRAAARTAEEVGAQLVLGDRPLEISLERAWNSLTNQQRTKLIQAFFSAMQDTSPVPPEELDRVRAEVDVTQLLERIGNEYPGFVNAMVTERDNYLAWSLKRSKAVNKGKRVLGVVGMGHLRGIQYVLEEDRGELRFQDLVESRNTREWKENRKREQAKQLLIDVVVWTAAFEGLKLGWEALTSGNL